MSLKAEIERAISRYQPWLQLVRHEPDLTVAGAFALWGGSQPFDKFDVRMLVPADFPNSEPTVFETGNRILPKGASRHINPDGSCCLGVWEEWLVKAHDVSFGGFLQGPVHDYFLSQMLFDKNGRWPFGERAHGAGGIVEAFAHVLQVNADPSALLNYLGMLATKHPTAILPCPCGSGQRLRDCHESQLRTLRRRITPEMARRMHDRLMRQLLASGSKVGRPKKRFVFEL